MADVGPALVAGRRTWPVVDAPRTVKVLWSWSRWPAGVEMKSTARSLARIETSDLLRLASLAAEVEAGLFARHPDGAGRYAGRLLCRALCQGAALHYLDGKNGVKDFDVWSFYAVLSDGPFPVPVAGDR